jgi:hypothetical protein
MDKIDAIATFRSLMPEPETVGFYDPVEHDGVVLEDLPDDWRCPRCKQGKEKFNKA